MKIHSGFYIVMYCLILRNQESYCQMSPNVQKSTTKNTVDFTENKGQVHDQNYKARPDVLFGTMAGNMGVHIKTNGVSYQLYRVDSYKEVVDVKTKEIRKEIDQQTIYRIDLNWLNANTNFTKTTDQALPGHTNYYLESCPNGALNVRSYTGVTLNNLYNGINLHYYEKNGELKHDYKVAPYANYKQIQVEVSGAEVNVNNDGSLLLTTPLGMVQEGAPIVYQAGIQLPARWVIKNNILSFEVENYDPNLELLIDPVTRLWGTYYGGSGDDYGYSCTTDGSGNVYMSGHTTSNNGTSIATSGSHQSVYGGSGDAFLVKFNASGTRQWATYYGGSAGELSYSCATDGSGNVYMSGNSNSNTGTVIATTGSHQDTWVGNADAFLVKFDSLGIRQWGTYYGGAGGEIATYCTTDALGNVYMSGYTNSNTGTSIATSGSHQDTNGGGLYDAFLVKFSTNGVRQWGTYYGGNGDDYGASCTTDTLGNVYMAGSTSSFGTVIATPGSHDAVFGGGGLDDAFLVKFSANGVRQWGTYYGGSGNDVATSCATDASGDVYLAGYTTTNTGTVIATPGSHQSVYGGSGDAFLVKFNSTGVRQWGTYYGGNSQDYGYSCTTDTSGNLCMAGRTSSSTGTTIATSGSYQSIYAGGSNDAFLVKFNTSGIRQWGTYYGEWNNDQGFSCNTDAYGNVYLSGHTFSGAALASFGSHQSTSGGGSGIDAFLVKFTDCIPSPPANTTPLSNLNICYNSYTTLSSGGTGTLSWYSALTGGIYLGSGSNFITPILNSNTTFYVQDSTSCGVSSRTSISVNIISTPPIPDLVSGIIPTCSAIGNTVLLMSGLSPIPGYNYNWAFSGGGAILGLGSGNTVMLTIDSSYINGIITVFLTDLTNTCAGPTLPHLLFAGPFAPLQPAGFTTFSSPLCANTSTIPFAVNNDPNASYYNWTFSGNGANISESGSNATVDFDSTATSGNLCVTAYNGGCNSIALCQPVVINPVYFTSNNAEICSGDSIYFGTAYLHSAGVYSQTLSSIVGCDSTVTLNLTVNPNNDISITDTICEGESYILGTQQLHNSGSYSEHFSNTYSCDSVVNLQLTVLAINSGVTQNQHILTANATGVNYQWIDCDNGNAPISGETNPSYTATTNGSYAVIVSEGLCIDTSNCYSITGMGVENNEYVEVSVFPNPTSDFVNVICNYEIIQIEIMDITGKKIFIDNKIHGKTYKMNVEILSSGNYIIHLQTKNGIANKKLMIQ